MNTDYNGWKNYATWRVNLEIFSGLWLPNYFEHNELPEDLAAWCKEYVEDFIEQHTDNNQIIAGWANAFLHDVSWHSIADHLLNDAEWPVETKDEE